MKNFFTSLLFPGARRHLQKTWRPLRISRDLHRHCTRICFLPSPFPPGKKRRNRRLDFLGRIGNKPWSYGNNHIRKRLDKISMLTEKFPDYPFDPVSTNSLPYSVDTYAQLVAGGAVRQINQGEIMTTHPFPLIVNLFILPGLDQQEGLGKNQGFHARLTVLLVQTGT